MTVTATYDSALSRVRVTATGLGSASVATVERSVDQVRWATIRGGSNVPVAAGSLAIPADDYEFTADVLNYYRVSYLATISYVGAGTAAHGSNATVVPTLHASTTTGDKLVLTAAIRNSGAGTVDTATLISAGWTLNGNAGNYAILTKTAGAAEGSPTVPFLGGVANATTSAQVFTFRNAGSVDALAASFNGSAQNISYPALTVVGDQHAVLVSAWKQDDTTGVTTLAGMTEAGEASSTLGDDQLLVTDYVIQTAAADIAAGSFTVAGGASAISTALSYALAPLATSQTGTITPTLSTVWLKSIGKPFLNRALVACNLVSPVTRASRGGLFEVIGRSAPVAITEVRGSRRYTLQVLTETAQEASDLDLALASGDSLWLHAPATFPEGSMYCVVGETTKMQERRSPRCEYLLPLIEVAAPVASIVGSTATYQTVKTTYATYADVLAAHATYASVLELIASPSEVIAP